MKYELLLMDADDTIFDYDRAEAYAFGATCDDLGVPYEEERHLPVYRRINEAMWKALERGEMDQAQLATERFRRTFEELRLEVDPQAFSDRYLGHLGEGPTLVSIRAGTIRGGSQCRRSRDRPTRSNACLSSYISELLPGRRCSKMSR